MSAETQTKHLADPRIHIGQLAFAAAIATSFVMGAGATTLLQQADQSRPARPDGFRDSSYDRVESMRQAADLSGGTAGGLVPQVDRSLDEIERQRGAWTGD